LIKNRFRFAYPACQRIAAKAIFDTGWPKRRLRSPAAILHGYANGRNPFEYAGA
jgi:hypothetical protein